MSANISQVNAQTEGLGTCIKYCLTYHAQKEVKALTMSERHDFSVMIVAAGNLVHYDQSLMELYTTPLLKGVMHLPLQSRSCLIRSGCFDHLPKQPKRPKQRPVIS
jgi:hypothetical protein